LGQVINEADLSPIHDKKRALLPLGLVLGIILFKAGRGLAGASYAQAMSIFKIQMFMHFTNLAAKNAAKERMSKYHPQKYHSNNTTRSVVRGLPPLTSGFYS